MWINWTSMSSDSLLHVQGSKLGSMSYFSWYLWWIRRWSMETESIVDKLVTTTFSTSPASRDSGVNRGTRMGDVGPTDRRPFEFYQASNLRICAILYRIDSYTFAVQGLYPSRAKAQSLISSVRKQNSLFPSWQDLIFALGTAFDLSAILVGQRNVTVPIAITRPDHWGAIATLKLLTDPEGTGFSDSEPVFNWKWNRTRISREDPLFFSSAGFGGFKCL